MEIFQCTCRLNVHGLIIDKNERFGGIEWVPAVGTRHIGGAHCTAVNFIICGRLHADEMVKGAIFHNNHNDVADDGSRPTL
jgi:hypothetical protein